MRCSEIGLLPALSTSSRRVALSISAALGIELRSNEIRLCARLPTRSVFAPPKLRCVSEHESVASAAALRSIQVAGIACKGAAAPACGDAPSLVLQATEATMVRARNDD